MPYAGREAAPKKAKRYGWYRKYNGFPSHPKWRAIARKLNIHVSRVVHVVDVLLDCASKNRRAGWIGNFDFEDCAETCDIPLEEVLAIYHELEEREWIAEEHVAEWADRNPDQEDPTSAERQRRRRARIIVRKKIASGKSITDEEAALLSRVTPKPALIASQRAQPLGVFVRVAPEDETNPEAVNAAQIATAANARIYLLGEGPSDWGSAAAVVADKAGMRVMAADSTIRRWVSEIEGDLIKLASLIDDANHGGVSGEAFEILIRQGIARHVLEKHRGPQLPLLGVAARKHG